MSEKKYSIFGAGAAGLYTAWRLLGGGHKTGPKAKALKSGDTLELYDWGKYSFGPNAPGTREAGARVCTMHYQDKKNASYVEVGGMRYAFWNGKADGAGHRLVTTVIEKLDLKKFSVPFNETSNQLYCLRARNMYLNGIDSANPAPYNVNNYGAENQPDAGFGLIQNIALTQDQATNFTRTQWNNFFNEGRITADLGETSIYKKGDRLRDIGYWNLMYDQLGSEGYQYAADGNGYSSNVINWHAADAILSNNEFTPGTQYRTLSTGYSSMFTALFEAIVKLAEDKQVKFEYYPHTRLHSILQVDKAIQFWTATKEEPCKPNGPHTTDAAWLAMPRYALDLVSQATRYQPHKGLDVLNHHKVQLYLESAIMEPSYKVGMFFDQEWWVSGSKANPTYPANVICYEFTDANLDQLHSKGFPESYIAAIKSSTATFENPIPASSDFVAAIENVINERLTVAQVKLVLANAQRNTIGPSVTDMPVRQVVYFGNNASAQNDKPVYGLLASYDDEQFTTFWQELEIGPNKERLVAVSENYQPLEGPRIVPEGMEKMLRTQLAAMHFGPGAAFNLVPKPLESRYMDWSLPPFNAGYHSWAAHYDIGDVQRKIRKPSQLIGGADASIFIVGETYSNDQAWVEGAYCTSESVLNDFFGFEPIIDNRVYPFICEPAG
jgi:hypothetical protein